MTIDIDETIRVLSNERACVMQNTEVDCDRSCAACDLALPVDLVLSAYRTAVEILQVYQEAEKNEPLTLKELQEEVENRQSGWLWCIDLSKGDRSGWYANKNLYKWSNLTAYGKTWVAYRRPPKEA